MRASETTAVVGGSSRSVDGVVRGRGGYMLFRRRNTLPFTGCFWRRVVLFVVAWRSSLSGWSVCPRGDGGVCTRDRGVLVLLLLVAAVGTAR